MANEFKHKDPGSELTQAEYISSDGTGHVFESQAQGDILYATSTTVLSRLGKDANATRALTNTGTNNNPAWTQIALATGVSGTLPVGNGGTGATTLTDGGILLGSGTAAVTAMAVLADSEMIVGDGTTDPVAESGATLRTSIGVGTGDSPQLTGIELGHATDSTITRGAAGLLEVEGVRLVTVSATQTLTNKTLTTPTIGSFANAGHDHADAAGGAAVVSAGAAVSGIVELAIAAEINTGTDNSRAMPIDQYVASNRNLRYVFYRIVASGTDVATATTVGGDFEFPFAGTITEVGTFNDTAGVTGTQVVDIHKGGTTIMSTHKCDTDTTEKTTRSGAQLPVLTTTSIAEGDILTFDIDAIHSGTAAKGLTVRIEVRVT